MYALYEKKICTICGKKYQPITPAQGVCSTRCKLKSRASSMRKYRAKIKEKKDLTV